MYEDGNALYAPYIHPWFNEDDELWFVISHAVPTWNVFLMRADLNWDQAGINLLAEGGFEEHPTQALSYKTMWHVNAAALTSRDAHSGKIACRFSNTNPASGRTYALRRYPCSRMPITRSSAG